MKPEISGPAQGRSVWRHPGSRLLPAVVLPLIIAAHLLSVLHLHPTKLFGLQQDDALYFSSAKALAEGRGYILPGLPGAPPATKYPILYPWLLSFVWRANANFPANLTLAFCLNRFFAIAAILLMYFFCRLPLRLYRGVSLGVAAFCALHPAFIFYSARLMTDVPFTALALAFLLFAWKATEGSATLTREALKWAALAGVFADLCVFMRLVGIAFVCGLFFVFLLRKQLKAAAVFVAFCIPAIFYFLYQGWFRGAAAPPAPFSAALPGWQQTWYYFTSYTSFRHLDSPNFHSAVILLVNQIVYFFSAVAGYFVSPLCDSRIVLWLVSTLALTTLVLIGVLRGAANCRCEPYIPIFLAYLLLLAGWDYVEWTRFLFPFFPLLVVLIVSEARRGFTRLRASGADWLTRSLLTFFLVFALALTAAAGWDYIASGRQSFAAVTRHRVSVLPEQQAVFEWIRSHTQPTDILITTEYGTTYLYTGRQSISFTVPLPYGVYDQTVLRRDLERMDDVGQALGARYWVIADYDPQTQLRAFEQPLRERLTGLEATLPRVYTTPGGSVRVYELRRFADRQ